MVVDLESQLEVIIDAFEAAQVPYALCGGLALAVHGFPRATKDLDFLVRLQDVALALDSLARAGFSLRAGPIPLGVGTPTPQTLHRATRIIEGEPCTVDLLIASPSYQPAWTSTLTIDWRGRPLRVVSREGLVSMKKLSVRLKDLADVQLLEGKEEP